MKGTEEEVGTEDSNGMRINEGCRNRRSGQVSAGAGLTRLDAPDSELFTILDLGDLPHQRRASRPSAGRCSHRRRNGLDGSNRDGFSNERGMTRHQELECMLTREREGLRFISSDVDCNIHSSHYGYKSATPLEVAWNAFIRGKSDTDLRVIVTWDVASVTNLIVYADTVAGANIEVRPDKSERNALCQVRRLNTVPPTKGIRSRVRQTRIPHQEGDAVTHERSTTDWGVNLWMLSGDAEVCAVHSGRLMTSRTRMTKLPEGITAEGSEGVTKENCRRCRRE